MWYYHSKSKQNKSFEPVDFLCRSRCVLHTFPQVLFNHVFLPSTVLVCGKIPCKFTCIFRPSPALLNRSTRALSFSSQKRNCLNFSLKTIIVHSRDITQWVGQVCKHEYFLPAEKFLHRDHQRTFSVATDTHVCVRCASVCPLVSESVYTRAGVVMPWHTMDVTGQSQGWSSPSSCLRQNVFCMPA